MLEKKEGEKEGNKNARWQHLKIDEKSSFTAPRSPPLGVERLRASELRPHVCAACTSARLFFGKALFWPLYDCFMALF